MILLQTYSRVGGLGVVDGGGLLGWCTCCGWSMVTIEVSTGGLGVEVDGRGSTSATVDGGRLETWTAPATEGAGVGGSAGG